MSPYVVDMDFINGGSESGGKKGVAKSIDGLTGERGVGRTDHTLVSVQGLLDSQTTRFICGVKQMSFTSNISSSLKRRIVANLYKIYLEG